jgi:murein DD-endopeptidase MepM/ murein hydrolase activator NlpD
MSQTVLADGAVESAHFTYQPAVLQDLTVSGRAVPATFVRDGSTITRSWKPAGPSVAAAGGWVAPIHRKITSGWGPRAVICTGGVGCDSGFHHGDDFGAPCNTPFYAVTAGVVTAVTHAGLAGDEIVITHAGGVSTAYSHMFDSGVLVSTGQRVTAGQNIGLVGSSGDSTGCHLYFEFRVNGTTVDPEPAMAAHGVILG